MKILATSLVALGLLAGAAPAANAAGVSIHLGGTGIAFRDHHYYRGHGYYYHHNWYQHRSRWHGHWRYR